MQTVSSGCSWRIGTPEWSDISALWDPKTKFCVRRFDRSKSCLESSSWLQTKLPSHTAPVVCVLVCCGFTSAVSQCGFWWGAYNGIKPCLDVMTVTISVFMELGICTFQVSSTSDVSVLSELILAKGDWSCTKLLPFPQFIQVFKPLKTGFLKWATI